jgi:transposase
MDTDRVSPPRSWREGRRPRALALHEEGWCGQAIAEALDVTGGAVSQWLKRARDGGAEALRDQPPPGPACRLSAQQQQVL